MSDISIEQVKELARAAGLEVDDAQAETISSRLGSIIAELDMIPDEALAEFEPASIFTLAGEEQGG